MEDVAHVDDLHPSVGTEGRSILATLHRAGREYFVCDEDVVLMPPRSMSSPDEARAPRGFDIPIQLVEIVLVLGDKLRILRAAALDTVPDVDDDEPVIPVAEIGKPVLYIHVMDVVALLVAAGAEAGDFLRVIGIVDVDDVQHAGRIIRQIDV